MLNLLIGCASTSNNISTADIHGRWLTITFSEDIKNKHDKKYDYPLEKHLMVFMPNGEWQRYSLNTGWRRMLLEYKMENQDLLVRPFDRTEFRRIGTFVPPDKLYLETRKSHIISYKKIDDNIDISEIDLSESRGSIVLKAAWTTKTGFTGTCPI